MPVQLTLRSPKGGRVLAEREYADGYRIDAVSGWLVVVDRNGSVVAAHAACPGLEGRIVEHASAAAAPAEVDEEDEGEVEFPDGRRSSVLDDPPLRVADVRDEGDRFAEELLDDLHRLGDTYGPLGVAIAAATLTDPQVLVRQIVDDHGGAEVLQGVPEPTPDVDRDRLERDEAREAAAEARRDRDAERTSAGLYRAEVEEQTARAEREHAARLRAERLLAEQQLTTGTLRTHLDAERARAEEAEVTLDLYRQRVGELPGPTSIGEARVRVTSSAVRAIEEDPRRPRLDAWPDDAVLLTYRELRRLIAVHLEQHDAGEAARAMLDGEAPLRVSEVLA
jgi:hypothetical protein